MPVLGRQRKGQPVALGHVWWVSRVVARVWRESSAVVFGTRRTLMMYPMPNPFWTTGPAAMRARQHNPKTSAHCCPTPDSTSNAKQQLQQTHQSRTGGATGCHSCCTRVKAVTDTRRGRAWLPGGQNACAEQLVCRVGEERWHRVSLHACAGTQWQMKRDLDGRLVRCALTLASLRRTLSREARHLSANRCRSTPSPRCITMVVTVLVTPINMCCRDL